MAKKRSAKPKVIWSSIPNSAYKIRPIQNLQSSRKPVIQKYEHVFMGLIDHGKNIPQETLDVLIPGNCFEATENCVVYHNWWKHTSTPDLPPYVEGIDKLWNHGGGAANGLLPSRMILKNSILTYVSKCHIKELGSKNLVMEIVRNIFLSPVHGLIFIPNLNWVKPAVITEET